MKPGVDRISTADAHLFRTPSTTMLQGQPLRKGMPAASAAPTLDDAARP